MKRGLLLACLTILTITCICVYSLVRIHKLDSTPYVFPFCVVIDNCRYLMTGTAVSDADTGVLKSGTIQSSVKNSALPTEHQSSNFGFPYKYRLMNDHTVVIFYQNKWIQFNLVSVYFRNEWISTDDLSYEAIEWILNYNNLSANEKQ